MFINITPICNKKDVEENNIHILPIADVSLSMYSQIFYHKKYLLPSMVEFLQFWCILLFFLTIIIARIIHRILLIQFHVTSLGANVCENILSIQ